MKNKLTLGLMVLAIGCGDTTDEGPTTGSNDNNNGVGKSDDFGALNTLKITGGFNETVQLDTADRCESNEFITIAEWDTLGEGRVDDREFSRFHIRFSHDLENPPQTGSILPATGGRYVAQLSGLGFTSEGGSGCDILVDELENEEKVGIAVTVENCEMINEFGQDPIRVSGSVFCRSDEPANNVVVEECDLNEYSDFLNTLTELTDRSRPDQGALQEHVDSLACRPVSAEPFEAYMTLFEDLMSRAGSSLDSNELATFEKVALAAPLAVDAASYNVWFQGYISRFESSVPSSGSSIDNSERAFLDQYHAIRPLSVDAAAYVTWSSLFSSQMERAVPSGGSSIDNTERTVLDEVLAVMPATQGDEAYEAWFPIYSRIFENAVPSGGSSIDNTERNVLEMVKQALPAAAGETAYLTWLPTFETAIERAVPASGSSIDNTEQTIIDELISIKPAGNSDGSYDAWFPLYERAFKFAVPSSSSSLDNNEKAVLASITLALPNATEGTAFLTWLPLFQETLNGTGSSVDNNETEILEALLSVRPCGENAESTSAFTSLLEENEGDDTESFVQQANPATCR